MKSRVPITSILTADPVTIDRDQPLSEVYHLLKSASFHHLPVMERDRPVGMVSSIDVLRLAYDVDGFEDQDMAQMLDYHFNIDSAMTTDLRILSPSASITDAASELADGKAHSVLICEESGSLMGIVTTTDLVRYLRDL